MDVHPFSIPLRMPFRGMLHRAGELIEGPAGWAEFSPLPHSSAAEIERCHEAAMDSACRPWPAPVRDRVAVNAIIPAVDPEMAHRIVRAARSGTAKVKVAEPGQSEADDLARIEAVRDALGPAGRLRIDVNGGWHPDRAVAMIKLLSRFELEYVEQPCPDLEGLAEVRRRVTVPIAADESIRCADDPLRVVATGAADVIVLKVAPLGGVRAALRIVEECGLPAVVSSALETSIGLAAGLALAAALPELPYACGLGTAGLLAGDVVAEPLTPVDGWLAVRRPAVDPSLLARYRPTAPTAESRP